MSWNADTLERLVPGALDPSDAAGAEALALHVERYEFAARQARPGRLLDLACGVGYGTRILAQRGAGVREALGVDVSEGALAYARDHYAADHVRFAQADAMHFSDAHGFDTVVSLETVEHVPDPVAFFARLVDLLRPEGVIVASVPTTPSVDLNPHHLHDFRAADLRGMGAAHGLREIASFPQVQRLSPLELTRGKRFKRDNLRPNLPGYYLAHPGALLRRALATLRHGFANHYLTVAWQRRD